MNACEHKPTEKMNQITFCKQCHLILVQSQTNNNNITNNSNFVNLNSPKANSNSSRSDSLKIVSTSIRPKDVTINTEINPLDTLRVLVNQTKFINLFNPYFLEYLSKRNDVLKQVRYLTRRFSCGEEVYSLTMWINDKVLSSVSNIKEYFDCISCNNSQISNNNYNLNNNTCISSSSYTLKTDYIISISFILSCKYLEQGIYIPEISDILNIHPKLSLQELQYYEIIVLGVLEYKLNWFTPFQCLQFFLNYGIFFEKELDVSMNTAPKTSKNVATISVNDKIESAHQLSFNILNHFISDYRSLEYKAYQIACSIICIVREQFKLKQKWHLNFSRLYGIKFEDFDECFFVAKKLFDKNINTNLDTAVSHYKGIIKLMSNNGNNIATNANNACSSFNIKAISEKFIQENIKYVDLYKSSSLDKSVFHSTSNIKNLLSSNKVKDGINSININKNSNFSNNKKIIINTNLRNKTSREKSNNSNHKNVNNTKVIEINLIKTERNAGSNRNNNKLNTISAINANNTNTNINSISNKIYSNSLIAIANANIKAIPNIINNKINSSTISNINSNTNNSNYSNITNNTNNHKSPITLKQQQLQQLQHKRQQSMNKQNKNKSSINNHIIEEASFAAEKSSNVSTNISFSGTSSVMNLSTSFAIPGSIRASRNTMSSRRNKNDNKSIFNLTMNQDIKRIDRNTMTKILNNTNNNNNNSNSNNLKNNKTMFGKDSLISSSSCYKSICFPSNNFNKVFSNNSNIYSSNMNNNITSTLNVNSSNSKKNFTISNSNSNINKKIISFNINNSNSKMTISNSNANINKYYSNNSNIITSLGNINTSFNNSKKHIEMNIKKLNKK